MSILSTDKKLISIGTDYSAGSGISIIDHTISIVPSAVGKVYSAGPNIGIYDVSGQPTISSKDWTQDIDQSSSGAVTESISYLNTWINGQYTEDISNVTNNLTALSGDLSSYYKKTETSSKAEISAALDYVSAHAVGDVEVNNYVHNNSATIDEVNSAYQSNSANYLTAVNLPESATWNETSNVVSSNSAQWSQGKTYEGISPIVVNNNESKISADTWTLTAGDGISFVENSANKVTRIDCTATGDAGVNSFVTNNSASILDVNSSYKAKSGTFLTAIPSDVATTGDVANLEQTITETYYTKSNPSSFATESWVGSQGYLTAHQDVSNKLDSSAFSSVSGDFLTTAFSIPESGVWNDTSNVVQTNSAQWAEGGSTLTGDAQGAVDLVYSTSGNIITGTKSDFSFTAKNVNNVTFGNFTIDGARNYIKYNRPGYPSDSWIISNYGLHIGPEFANGYQEQYKRVWLERTGLSSMSGSKSDKKLIWRALLDTDVEGANNTITAIAGSAIGGGGVTGEFVPQSAFDELKASYDALSASYVTLSSLFATYSGQWLLPNEGV